ncbi:MAG TPA: hypothetical protein PLC11_00275 [bacterium]|nr:hypothetical protein [bacterium]
MICTRCNRQMADDSTVCPHCGQPVVSSEQVMKEIKVRRLQRYLFYTVVVLIVIAAVAIMVRIYNNNTKLVLEISQVKQSLEGAQGELTAAQSELEQKKQDLAKIQAELAESARKMEAADSQLKEKTAAYQNLLTEKTSLEQASEQCRMNLNLADANIYGLIVKLGTGVTNKNLMSIPLADANLGGEDSDDDGLSDTIERSLGSDPNKADTDGDGYDDKVEWLRGYNPLGEGMLPINPQYVNTVKGKILLQIEGDKSAWYVAGDGKRYYLGNPGDAYAVMRQNEYWTKDWPGYAPPLMSTSEETMATE